MPRLSKLLEKLEDTVEARWGVWFQRHKKKLPLYIPVGLVCWYFYGMLLNSMRLGIDAVFHRVRHRLHDLDNLTLRDTEQRLRANQDRNIRNSIQYTMAVLFNCITEGESDLVVDPYLNSLGGP